MTDVLIKCQQKSYFLVKLIMVCLFKVDGQQYTGQGRSKKIARMEAAAAALRSFIQFKDGAALTPLKPTNNVDFTSDEHLENGISHNIQPADILSTIHRSLDAIFDNNLNNNKLAWVSRVESKYYFYDFMICLIVFLSMFIGFIHSID